MVLKIVCVFLQKALTKKIQKHQLWSKRTHSLSRQHACPVFTSECRDSRKTKGEDKIKRCADSKKNAKHGESQVIRGRKQLTPQQSPKHKHQQEIKIQ